MKKCASISCNHMTYDDVTYCNQCLIFMEKQPAQGLVQKPDPRAMPSIADKYPQYYKRVNGMQVVDVYAVHMLFDVQDPSGCIQHASKKLLLSGARTGGKSAYKDVKEARDTLTRWLELHSNEEKES